MSDLKKAYNFHRYGMYDKVITLMSEAYIEAPYSIEVYRVSMKILAEAENPPIELQRMFQAGVSMLFQKHPRIWLAISKEGERLVPRLENWDLKPDLS